MRSVTGRNLVCEILEIGRMSGYGDAEGKGRGGKNGR